MHNRPGYVPRVGKAISFLEIFGRAGRLFVVAGCCNSSRFRRKKKIFPNNLKLLGKYDDKYIRHVFTHSDKQILLKKSISI